MAIMALREPERASAYWEWHRDTIQCPRCEFGMFPIAYAFDRGDCVGTDVIPRYCPKCGAILEVDV